MDSGKLAGVSNGMAEVKKELAPKNLELRQANEILRKASAGFSIAELDHRHRT